MAQTPSNRRPIATRTFESAGGSIELSIYPPKIEDVDYSCEYEIRRADGSVRAMRMAGVDSIQALLLAIAAARVDILYPEVGERDPTVRWLEMETLGLDIPQHE